MHSADITKTLLELYRQGSIDKQTARALLEAQEKSSPPADEPIAIIGMACRFPGAATEKAFWEILLNGQQMITSFPVSRRHDIDPLIASIPEEQFSSHSDRYWRGAFLSNIDGCDAQFFGFSPAEAVSTDPQQRIFLEMAHEALFCAGIPSAHLKGSATGVYIGNTPNEYQYLLHDVTPAAVVGNISPFVASRVCRHFDLKGPCLDISTTCSSSLVAVHAACRALLSGECSLAIAGAINIRILPLALRDDPVDALGIISPDGECRPFDRRANGIMRGEGGGCLVLKRLSEAKRDRDFIWATILATGVNQDGLSSNIGSPNPESQAALFAAVHDKAAIDPRSIVYWETHGTGTKVGDPLEINAMTSALRRKTSETQFCSIGSVKANIGHLTGGAAGLAGLIKAALVLHHKKVPPQICFDAPNELISFPQTPFFISPTPSDLAAYGASPRRAAVNAFGFNGTNAHVLLEEHNNEYAAEDSGPFAIPLSADSDDHLRAWCRTLSEELPASIPLACIASSLTHRTDARPVSISIEAPTTDAFKRILRSIADGAPLLEYRRSADPTRISPKETLHAPFPPRPWNRKRFWPNATALSGMIYRSSSQKGAASPCSILLLMRDILGCPSLRSSDNFFTNGGDSLRAVQLIGAIHRHWNVKLSLDDLFANPQADLLERLLQGKQQSSFVPIQPSGKSSGPLSYGQQRLLILHQMEERPTTYNMCDTLTIKGPLNTAAFRSLLDNAVVRHPSLRTRFPLVNGQLVQEIVDPSGSPLSEEDLRAATSPHETALHRSSLMADTPFDIHEGPLWKATLFRTGDEEYLFTVVMHHAIADGASIQILVKEILDKYTAPTIQEKPQSALSYLDFSIWQRAHDASLQPHKLYWLNTLSEAPVTEIPGDLKRPPIFDFTGGTVRYEFSKEESLLLQSLVNQHQSTIFTTLVSAVFIYLFRMTGQEDLVIGSPTAGRFHPDTDSLIGFFVNTLVLRAQLRPTMTCSEVVSRLGQTIRSAIDHQEYPFDHLVNELQLPRDTSRSPLFNINVALQPEEIQERTTVNQLSIQRIRREQTRCRWDLEFEFIPQADGSLLCQLHYYQSVYSRSFAESMIADFVSLLRGLIRTPECTIASLPVAIDSTRLQKTSTEILNSPPVPLADRFFLQAHKTPHAIALRTRDDHCTYQELDAKANKVAHFLIEKAVAAKDARVALLLPASKDAVVAILGILKAGCTYVPLDITAPHDRLIQQLSTVSPCLLIACDQTAACARQLQLELPFALLILDADIVTPVPQTALSNSSLWNQVADEASNFIAASGWVSSFTGNQFSAEEMNEYSRNVALKLCPLIRPESRILEIGCGSGFTASALAPHAGEYWAIDPSEGALRHCRQACEQLSNLYTARGSTEDLSAVSGPFDIIVINSVLHCLPSLFALEDLVQRLFPLLSTKGHIFFGDILDADKRCRMIADLEQYALQAKNDEHTKTRWDQELFISRSFLEDFIPSYPAIRTVFFSSKYGNIENECVRYRFDALFTIDKTASEPSYTRKHHPLFTKKDLVFCSESDVPTPRRHADLAYLLFTSGSTGLPKAVAVGQESVDRYLQWCLHTYFPHTPPQFPLLSALHFDLSVTALFTPLLCGGTVLLYDGTFEEMATTASLHSFVDTIKVTPSHLSLLDEWDLRFPSLRTCIIGGEALPSQLLSSFAHKHPRTVFYNEYGPTEATVGCVVQRIESPIPDHWTIAPIGAPIDGTQCAVLSSYGAPVPMGASGELYIGGECLAKGYWNDPTRTSERFYAAVADSPIRFYQTGDLVRLMPGGEMLYTGRCDRQVKVHGIRLELNEVEALLIKHREVAHAAAFMIDHHLAVAVVMSNASSTDHDRDVVLSLLSRSLPPTLLPHHIFCLDKLPLSKSGKIDYTALRGMASGPRAEKPARPAADACEAMMIEMLQELFPHERPSVDSDFFSLGGDSISAMRLLSGAKSRGWTFKLQDLFRWRTVNALRPYIKEFSPTICSVAPAGQPLVLSPLQQLFFDLPLANRDFFTMSYLFRIDESVDVLRLRRALTRCIEQHEQLRLRLSKEQVLSIASDPFYLFEASTHDFDGSNPADPQLLYACHHQSSSLRLEKTPVAASVWTDRRDQRYLLLTIHHLAVDGVSWRILLEDLSGLYYDDPLLPPTALFSEWTRAVSTLSPTMPLLPVVPFVDTPFCSIQEGKELSLVWTRDETSAIYRTARQRDVACTDLLLMAFGRSLFKLFPQKELTINLESHGRTCRGIDLDISRTIGWFTALFPMTISAHDCLATVHSKRTEAAERGVESSAALYLGKNRSLGRHRPQILFNDFGQISEVRSSIRPAILHAVEQPQLLTSHPTNLMMHHMEMNCSTIDGVLRCHLAYNPLVLDSLSSALFIGTFRKELATIVS